jgi:hypothetical protein
MTKRKSRGSKRSYALPDELWLIIFKSTDLPLFPLRGVSRQFRRLAFEVAGVSPPTDPCCFHCLATAKTRYRNDVSRWLCARCNRLLAYTLLSPFLSACFIGCTEENIRTLRPLENQILFLDAEAIKFAFYGLHYQESTIRFIPWKTRFTPSWWSSERRLDRRIVTDD